MLTCLVAKFHRSVVTAVNSGFGESKILETLRHRVKLVWHLNLLYKPGLIAHKLLRRNRLTSARNEL